MSKHTLDQIVTDAEKGVSGFARAVALKRAAITAAVGTALEILVLLHVITPGLSADATKGIAIALGALGTIGAGAWIHQAVTPADVALAPKSSTGVALVGADVAAQAVLQASAPPAPVATDPDPDADLGLIPETGQSVIDVSDPPVDPAPPTVQPATTAGA